MKLKVPSLEMNTKICQKGHVYDQSCRQCPICKYAFIQEWRKKNKDKVEEYHRTYRRKRGQKERHISPPGMSWCSFCKKEKAVSCFHSRSANGRLDSLCLECKKEYNRNYYGTNRAHMIEDVYRRRIDTKKFVDSLKDVPCADCGEKFPPYVMDFDHLSDKSFLLGKAVHMNISKKRIIEEAAKCDVVCSNCHRIRTHERRSVGVTARQLFRTGKLEIDECLVN